MNDKTPQQLPPLTRGQKIKYLLVTVIIVAGIGGLIAWNISASTKDNSRSNDLKTSGLRVTGTATGEAHTYTDRSKRGGTSERYKAVYSYIYADETRDNRQVETTAIGEKIYDTKEEVEALKGKTATIYYDPNDASKGAFVDDES